MEGGGSVHGASDGFFGVLRKEAGGAIQVQSSGEVHSSGSAGFGSQAISSQTLSSFSMRNSAALAQRGTGTAGAGAGGAFGVAQELRSSELTAPPPRLSSSASSCSAPPPPAAAAFSPARLLQPCEELRVEAQSARAECTTATSARSFSGSGADFSARESSAAASSSADPRRVSSGVPLGASSGQVLRGAGDAAKAPDSLQSASASPARNASASSLSPSAGSEATPWRTQNNRPSSSTRRFPEVVRPVNALLNKLTIEKFDVIAEKMARVLEGSLWGGSAAPAEVETLVHVIVDKAVAEAEWLEMYADLLQVLYWRSVQEEGDPEAMRKTAFMLALLTKVQEEFEALPRASELGAGVPDPLDEAAAAALAQSKRRMMGIVMLIGELFQRRVLGFKIVNDVVVKLVISEQVPPEHSVECFLQLIATVGFFMESNPKMIGVLNSWFGRVKELQGMACYTKRLKCVIQDTLDMRKAQWRRKLHRDRAKALSQLRDQLQTEEVLGGAVHAAQYGNIVVMGARSNLGGAYLGYMEEQEKKFQEKVQRRHANARRVAAAQPPRSSGGASQ